MSIDITDLWCRFGELMRAEANFKEGNATRDHIARIRNLLGDDLNTYIDQRIRKALVGYKYGGPLE